MAAFETATLMLFPGLGLVALAVGLLARRYSRSALAAGLVGLLMLATASTWITTAGRATGRAQTVPTSPHQPNPQGERVQEPGPPPPPAPPNAEMKRAENELQADQKRRAEAETKAADADRRAADAAEKVAILEGKVRDADNGRLDAERRAALAEAKQCMQPSMPSPLPSPPDLPSILRRLAVGDPRHFTTQEERALISAKTGSWYRIRLLQDGKDLSFGDRQFVLTDATAVKASIARLCHEILLPLSHANVNRSWRLFVRGSADARPVAGEVGRDVIYLPRLENGLHSSEPKRKPVALPVPNEELPNLRAEWLREIVRSVLGTLATSEIEILENPPQRGHGRTAELVLYVQR